MMSSGMRHAFLCQYKVGADPTGKVLALDLKFFNNGGYSVDLSPAVSQILKLMLYNPAWVYERVSVFLQVMEKAMLECCNAYDVPNVRVEGTVCKTNTVSNTAFRGFGAVQGMLIAETWMSHLIERSGLDANTVRDGKHTYNLHSEFWRTDKLILSAGSTPKLRPRRNCHTFRSNHQPLYNRPLLAGVLSSQRLRL